MLLPVVSYLYDFAYHRSYIVSFRLIFLFCTMSYIDVLYRKCDLSCNSTLPTTSITNDYYVTKIQRKYCFFVVFAYRIMRRFALWIDWVIEERQRGCFGLPAHGCNLKGWAFKGFLGVHRKLLLREACCFIVVTMEHIEHIKCRIDFPTV